MEIFDTVVLVFTIFADVYMAYDFFANTFERRELFKGKSRYIILLLFMMVIYGFNIIGNSYLNLIGSLVVNISIVCAIFVAPILVKIAYAVIAWMIIIFGEFLFLMILAVPSYVFRVNMITNLADMSWVIIAVKLVSYIIFIVAKQLSAKGKYHMPKKIFIMYMCQPVVCMVIMLVMIYTNTATVITDDYRIGMTLSFSLLLISSIIVFYAFNRYALQMGVIMEQQARLMKQEADEGYYKLVAEMNEKHRRFIHDVNNHFKVISGLAQEGDTERIIRLVEEYTGEIDRSKAGIYCRHAVTNAILNEKMKAANDKGIPMDIEVTANGEILEHIKDGDIVSILGNLLDNALRAAEGCDEDKAYVKVMISVKNMGRTIVMDVKNSYSEKPVRGVGGFVTTKRDKKNHGIGLKNVQHTVEKYNGFFVCTAEAGEFSALVELNMDK